VTTCRLSVRARTVSEAGVVGGLEAGAGGHPAEELLVPQGRGSTRSPDAATRAFGR
jgi:hypothetical protein